MVHMQHGKVLELFMSKIVVLHAFNKFSRFKATFGELKYFIEGEEFTYVIQTMINMIEYENDKDILQVKKLYV